MSQEPSFPPPLTKSNPEIATESETAGSQEDMSLSADEIVGLDKKDLFVGEEDRAKKRARRLLQNRQSAALSRQRKKDYVSGLEKKVQSLEQELQAAQQRIAELENWYKMNKKEGDPELPKPMDPILAACSAEGSTVQTTEKENEN